MAKELKIGDPVFVMEDGKRTDGKIIEIDGDMCTVDYGSDYELDVLSITDVTLIEPEADKTPAEDGKVSLEDQLKEERNALELEKAELVEQQKELKQQQEQVATNIEKSITISDSQVDFGKYNKSDNPKAFEAEAKKQAENVKKRHANRIEKAKIAATMTAVQIREGILRARLTKVRMKHHHTYKKEQIELWAQELTIIIQTPDAWSKNCVRPKKQMSAMDKLDKLMGG